MDPGKTELFADAWLPPVDSAAELPAGAAEGAMCFVTGEQRTWVVHEGVWRGIGAPKPPPPVTPPRSTP